MNNFKETEFVRLGKSVMEMNNCSFPEVAEQLIFAGWGPAKYRRDNVAEIDRKNKGETNGLWIKL